MWERLHAIHFGEKLLSIYGPMSLENKSISFHIQWWKSYRTDAPIPKEQSYKENSKLRQILLDFKIWNDFFLFQLFAPCGCKATPLLPVSLCIFPEHFFFKNNVCSQLSTCMGPSSAFGVPQVWTFSFIENSLSSSVKVYNDFDIALPCVFHAHQGHEHQKTRSPS